jgi:transcriptional regulator
MRGRAKDTAEPRLELLQGTLELLILQTLRWGPLHGHGIALFIEQTSGSELVVEHGSLYPALQRLLKQRHVVGEWATTENNRRARYYRLTASGREQLDRSRSRWDRYARAVAAVMRPVEE